jgi:FKBP-type peptidyl-prolyl cis-trans isomerase FkpA
MYKLIIFVAVTFFITPALAAAPPVTEQDKILYAVGLKASRQLSVFHLTPAELEIVQQGIADGVNGSRVKVEVVDAYNDRVLELAQTRTKQQAQKTAPLYKEFMLMAAKEPGAVKTGSGLIYIPIVEGSGFAPGLHDTVKVDYRGTLPDGQEFDSTNRRGMAAKFRLDMAIPCWKEGLQKIKAGGKIRLVCPAATAYGEAGLTGVIPPNCPLAFEVELMEVKVQN